MTTTPTVVIWMNESSVVAMVLVLNEDSMVLVKDFA
ncbi:hypothetical protein A2U01_0116244, partial [Trifolium medium]|nr:hypothetical protein [Trifolium medium]